jgi:hypothetical protein
MSALTADPMCGDMCQSAQPPMPRTGDEFADRPVISGASRDRHERVLAGGCQRLTFRASAHATNRPAVSNEEERFLLIPRRRWTRLWRPERRVQMSIDPPLERRVLAELAFRERREQRHRRHEDRSQRARDLAEILHRGSEDLVAHLTRVAWSLPERCRSVAWLHHAGETDVTARGLAAAGLTSDEVAAIELLAPMNTAQTESSVLRCARALSGAPGMAGVLARGVARAAIQDRLDRGRPDAKLLAALALLPDTQLER